jgi:hypothetical protein
MAPNIALLTPEAQGQAFAFCSVPKVGAGVSQLAFNPVQPHILYGAFRRHINIYAWDLRGDTSTPVQTMCTGDVQGTNQRLRFDVDRSGTKLLMGETVRLSLSLCVISLKHVAQSGYVSVFDLIEHFNDGYGANEDRHQLFNTSVEPALRFEAHSGEETLFWPWRSDADGRDQTQLGARSFIHCNRWCSLRQARDIGRRQMLTPMRTVLQTRRPVHRQDHLRGAPFL